MCNQGKMINKYFINKRTSIRDLLFVINLSEKSLAIILFRVHPFIAFYKCEINNFVVVVVGSGTKKHWWKFHSQGFDDILCPDWLGVVVTEIDFQTAFVVLVLERFVRRLGYELVDEVLLIAARDLVRVVLETGYFASNDENRSLNQ